jgi:hypothetical protein
MNNRRKERFRRASAQAAKPNQPLAQSDTDDTGERGPVAWLCECKIRGGSNYMLDFVTVDRQEAEEYASSAFDGVDVRIRPLFLAPPRG